MDLDQYLEKMNTNNKVIWIQKMDGDCKLFKIILNLSTIKSHPIK